MAQLLIPRLPSGGGASRGGLFSALGLLAVLVMLFLLYLVSPFFTVGEYERTVVTRFGQFSSLAGPGEANAVREQARGMADGELLLAAAQAKGKELAGLAEAEALEAQSIALQYLARPT